MTCPRAGNSSETPFQARSSFLWAPPDSPVGPCFMFFSTGHRRIDLSFRLVCLKPLFFSFLILLTDFPFDLPFSPFSCYFQSINRVKGARFCFFPVPSFFRVGSPNPLFFSLFFARLGLGLTDEWQLSATTIHPIPAHP